MPTPAPGDAPTVSAPTPPAPAPAPATDKPAAPALASGRTAPAKATVVTADAVDVSGKRTYTVAPGRTLSHGHPVPEGSPSGTMPKVDHLKGNKDDPSKGDTVELEEGDAKRLIELGFLLAPDGSRVIPVDGPATDVDNGVAMTTDLKDGGPTITQA